MKKYFSMLGFVLIMGILSSAILMGADMLTRDRIALNAEYAWKTAIMKHHEIEFTDANFADVFETSFEESSAEDSQGNMRYLYVNTETGAVSYQFSGSGLWDVIRGVISLESDFQTIIKITVTQQGETPGLGGVVAEEPYLANYIGRKFDESLGLVAVKTTPATDYEVDAITGATGTSNAFVGLLSVDYRIMLNLFGDVNPLAVAMKSIMTHNDVVYTNDDFEAVFAAEFDTNTIDDLTLYTHKTNGNVSFTFTTGGFNGPIDAVVTLDSNYEMVIGINVISQSEGWGAVIQTDPEILEFFVGRTFAPEYELPEDYDGFGGATTTRKNFLLGLNAARDLFYGIFIDGIDPNMVWQQALLANNGIESTEDNFKSLFNSTFTIETSDELTLYINNSNQDVSFLFETDGFAGVIKGVLTLESDYETIVGINVYQQTETWGAVIQTEADFFDAYVGKKFAPEISFVETPETDSEITDGYGGATTTKSAMLDILNSTRLAYYQAFVETTDPDMAWQQAMLANNGIESTESDYQSLFTTTFTQTTDGDLTLYTNNSNQNVSFLFETDGFAGVIQGVLTLDDDFETIVKISVYTQSENWGGRIQTDLEFFDAYIGKRFTPDISFVETPATDTEVVDGYGGATTTKNAMLDVLNETRLTYYQTFMKPDMVSQQALLASNSVESTYGDYEVLFASTFTESTDDDLTLYTNNSNQNVSFLFETEGFAGSIYGVLTLEDDFETIVNITVYEQTEKWGARIQTDLAFFDPYIGKKFTPDISFVETPASDTEVVDGYGGATTTKNAMLDVLNQTRLTYYQTFKKPDMVWQQSMLSGHDVTYTYSDYEAVFASTFTTQTDGDLTLYTNTSNQNISFLFETEGFAGTINGVLTLASDFETIINITVYDQSERWGARIQTNLEFFDPYIGKKFAPTISIVSNPETDSEIVDGYGSATTTKNSMLDVLNQTVAAYKLAFSEEA